MKSITIQGKKRESVGKASTRALRNADQVPCVVYGNAEPIHFSAEEKSFKDLIYTPDAHTVVLELEGQGTISAILQDVQFHRVTDRILHADFYQYSEDKPITMDIPVRLEGRSKGVLSGGVMRFALRKIRMRALPKDMPDELVVDITNLAIGDKVEIKDLLQDNFSLLHADNAVVVAVRMARAAMAKSASADLEEGEEGEEGTENTEGEGAAGGDQAEVAPQEGGEE